MTRVDMDAALQELLKIASKRFGVVFSPEEFVPYSRKQPDSFQQFLIAQRLRPFMQFNIIWQLCNAATFLVGQRSLSHTTFAEEEEAETHDFGPCLALTPLSDEQLFENILSSLGFEMLHLRPSPLHRHVNINAQLPLPQAGQTVVAEGDIYIMFRPEPALILTETEVYALEGSKNASTLKGLLAYHRAVFDDFLAAHDIKKTVGVPHALYVDWLMRWYPGRIHLKSLGHRPAMPEY